MKVKDAIKKNFVMGGIPDDGGYLDRFFLIRLGGLPFVMYNFPSRVKAAKIHDIHHVATGFRTDFKGECEIGAWEVASGCGSYLAAWMLNLMALSVGIFIWPKAMWTGFLRGRNSKNFYHIAVPENIYDFEMEAIPKMLSLDQPLRPWRLADLLAFIFWGAFGVTFHLSLFPFYLLFPFHYVTYKLLFDKDDRLKRYTFLRR